MTLVTKDGTVLNMNFAIAVSPIEKLYNASVKNEDGSHKKDDEVTNDMVAGYFFSVQFASGYTHSFPVQVTDFDDAERFCSQTREEIVAMVGAK